MAITIEGGITLGGGISFTAGSAATDPYWSSTSLLVPGNGSNGDNNNTFVDSSTNNFGITRVGTPGQGTLSPFNDGYYQTYFNGSTSLISSAMPAPLGTQTFTVECWVYPTTTAGNNIFDNRPGGGNGAYLDLWYAAGSHVEAMVNAGALVRSTVGPTINTWNHIAYVRTAGTGSIYLNGTRVATGTDNINYLENQWKLGYAAFGAGTPTHSVSNFRVVLGTALYSGATYTVPTAPLTAISGTALLTCQSPILRDNSTNALTFTLNGTLSIQPSQLFNRTSAYSPSTNGGSMYFSGAASTWLAVPINTDFAFGTNNYTYEAWVYPTALPNAYNTVFCNFRDDEGTKGWSLLITGSGAVHVNNQGAYNNSTNTISLNTWTHIAVCRVGNTVTRYINGIADPTTLTVTASVTNVAAQGPTIGGSPEYAGSRSWSGYITNARVVSGTALYTSNFTPSLAPLTAITNTSLLLLGTNGSIIDNTMNNNLATVSNASISTAQSKWGGSSVYLDGSSTLIVPANDVFNVGTGAFTIECWVYPETIGVPYPTILSSRDGWSPGAWGLRFNNTGQANKFSFHATSIGDPFIASSSTFSFNQWHHVAVTRSGNTFTLWVNGTLQATGTSATALNLSYNTGIVVGQSPWDGAAGYYKGYVDDLRITKGVARYTSNFSVPTEAFPIQG